MLGQGNYRAYLHDRGGEVRLGEFERIRSGKWGRILNDVSEASLIISTPPNIPNCCYWLGDIRSFRHELVLFRNGERIWEGPVVDVQFFQERVEVTAHDVLVWPSRRASRGRFALNANVVSEGRQALLDCFLYDDPNVVPFLDARTAGGKKATTAYNPQDAYYLDVLDDYVDQGLNFATVGRAVVLWAQGKQIGQTALLRSSADFLAEVSVHEDGLSLATRVITTGGETWGSTHPDPVLTNYSTNPSLRTSTTGYRGTTFFPVSRGGSGDGSYGQIDVNPPAKPGSGASAKTTNKYNKRLNDYQRTEIIGDMFPQQIAVQEGQQISATLRVWGFGTPLGKISIGLRGIFRGHTDPDDRNFAESEMITLKTTTQDISVTGTVPEKTDHCFVTINRDSSVEWSGDEGVRFSRFGLWWGRPEIADWFDGATADTADFDYAWTGAADASRSTRKYKPFFAGDSEQPKIDAFYGQVEILQSTNDTERSALEDASDALLSHSYPSPLSVSLPPGTQLSPNAQVSVSELVAGTTVPIQTVATCRQLRATCTLTEVEGSWDNTGEQVLITVTSGQVFEIEEVADADGTVDPADDVAAATPGP